MQPYRLGSILPKTVWVFYGFVMVTYLRLLPLTALIGSLIPH